MYWPIWLPVSSATTVHPPASVRELPVETLRRVATSPWISTSVETVEPLNEDLRRS